MRYSAGLWRFVCVGFVLSLMASGCGMPYPYYTLEGSPESREVVIHLSDSETIEVPAGTGMGAGLTSDQQMQIMQGEPVVLEKDGAKVTMASSGGPITVQKVEYEGKEVYYHEPVL